ncbi:unnamed protein product [Sphacelaria rigidula]
MYLRADRIGPSFCILAVVHHERIGLPALDLSPPVVCYSLTLCGTMWAPFQFDGPPFIVTLVHHVASRLHVAFGFRCLSLSDFLFPLEHSTPSRSTDERSVRSFVLPRYCETPWRAA